jgi:mono/diheme cytochrome c family protein
MRRTGLLVTALLILAGPLSSALAGGQAMSVQRGQYLARAGNCVSCHTRAGGEPFTGGVAFKTPFGVIYSTNITPDNETGIGRWTAADLRRAMHEGIARDGSRLFPAFPYTSYTKVTDADVDDISAYLRTLTPVNYTPPSNGMIFYFRWPLAVWNRLYFKPGRYDPDVTKDEEWNRGAYLIEGLGHCSACHTPRNRLLAEQPVKAYQGGVMQGEVAPGRQRPWSAVNLTSAKHGLAAWSVTDLTRYFQTGVSSRGGTFGPMNEVIVNSLRHMKPEDLKAMAVYVKSLEGPAYEGVAVSEEEAKEGAALYERRCEKCHGTSGRGGFFTGPPLAGSAIVQGENPASLINLIVHGPLPPEEVSFGAWETMPSYADVLSDSDIVAVSNYVRGSWGNTASPVTLEQVQQQR